jgi:molybdopterin-synthase adenylyltransferase
MVVDDSAQKLRALPTQLIETDEGIILKRGVTTIRIGGDRGVAVVQRILVAAEEGVTREEIRLWFAQSDRDAVDNLVEQLLARRILVWADREEATASPTESSLDVFYWNFGSRTGLVANQLDQRRLAIIGVNHISQRLTTALAATGVSNFKVVDYHLLRNLRLFDEAGYLLADGWGAPAHTPVEYREWAETLESEPPGCIVVTSDFGGTLAVREWNRHCVEQNWHFLPVVLLDLVGYIGPLVIPGETACYECLRARQNSHIEDPAAARAPERKAFEGQYIQGFHPSMASVLGDLAVLELTKFYSDCLPLWRVGTLIEVNLLAPSLVTRKVLKVPRCTVCGKMNTRSSPALDVSINVPQE